MWRKRIFKWQPSKLLWIWIFGAVRIGNSMICSDIWHKYHKWNLRQFWNITSGIYAKYLVQIMRLFVYTTTHKRFVIFTCRYFKLSWNTTALSQSNCRNFTCSSITRTTEKNYYLGRLLWSCLKPQAGFAKREKKLYCRLDCSSEWLHSLYLYV